MAAVSSRSWTTVLIVAALVLVLLLAASPETQEQARQGAAQFGAIMVQLFIDIGNAIRSLVSFQVDLGSS